MNKLFYFLFVVAFASCNQDFEQKIEDKVDLSTTRSVSTPSGPYYWCDGVKIPLSVNENKMFVLAKASKYERVSKRAVDTGSTLENVSKTNRYTSLGVKSVDKRVEQQANLISFTLDKSNLSTLNPKDLVYSAPYFKTEDGA